MVTTLRLYHDDPELRNFEARVLLARPGPGGSAEVLLDRTAFYPTGGGQPHDLGTLGGRAVLEVFEEGEAVVHRLDGPVAGETVRGEVDWDRRLDHRQQHTGQHLLSRAFLDAAGAGTVGFHLGAARCTIDLDREDLSEASVERAEREANAAVLADLPVTVAWYDDPARVPREVRKDVPTTGRIRVVSVGNYDHNLCCGTHCPRSGQVGPVKVLRWERRKGGIRLEFVCGGRALADHRAKHAALRGIALALTTEELEVPGRVASLVEEHKALRARVERTEAELRGRLIAAWAAEPGAGAFHRDLGPERAGWLAAASASLAEARGEPVLLTSEEADGVRVALAAPAGGRHAGNALKALLAGHGGRGGGSDRVGQGRVPADRLAGLLGAWAAGPGMEENT